MPGAQNGKHFVPPARPDMACQVVIPLVDQDFLDDRQLFGKLLHHVVHLGPVLQLFYLLALNFILAEGTGHKETEQAALSPEGILCPCPPEGHRYGAVHHRSRQPQFL